MWQHLFKSVERFSRVRRSNDSNVTRVCWRGNEVNTGFQYPQRTIEKALGEAPLYSGRNVLMDDPNMRTNLHTQLRGRFVEMLAIFQVRLTGKCTPYDILKGISTRHYINIFCCIYMKYTII